MAPLRHRGYRLLLTGQFASNVGDAFYAVALPWYVLATHGGALLLGTVLAAYGVPRTVLLAVGGHASDRWRPWTVMMGSDAARGICAAALALAAMAGPARAVLLVPIAVVLGAGEGLFLPGSFAIVPALLPDTDLQAGNALTSGGTQLAMLAGPALGGALVALAGPASAFALDAASFAVSALTLAGVRLTSQRSPAGTAGPDLPLPVPVPAGPAPAGPGRPEPGGTVPADRVPADRVPADRVPADRVPADRVPADRVPADRVPAGPQAAAPARAAKESPSAPTLRNMLRSERVLQIILLVNVAANVGLGGIDGVAIPSLAHGPLHTGAEGYAALIAAFGGGALLGTLTAGQARRARRPVIVGSAAFLAEALFVAIVPYLGGVILTGAALAVSGMMEGFGNVVMITVFQRWAPPALLGRLTGLLLLTSYGVFPVSVALAAVVVRNAGPQPFFPLAGAALAAAIVVGLTQRGWRTVGTSSPSPQGYGR